MGCGEGGGDHKREEHKKLTLTPFNAVLRKLTPSASISSLVEPFIIVFLGTLIGGLVVALYLPIFNIGQAL